ncbi:hypothetical protein Q1695_007030 [Nippostrongylus brasiliensis]|nr:hypothetical protein Q1695_007030 [Nippostrongylus brasiliensis]
MYKEKPATNKPPARVIFHSDENIVYTLPPDECAQSPISTLSTCSSEPKRYMDEIALLKRGKITRDTPRHTYRRGSVEPNAEVVQQDMPITLAELNTRGLKLDDERIIYSIPPKSTSTFVRNSSLAGSTTSDSSRKAGSFIHSPKNVKEFSVGYPDENAKLRVSSIAENGRSYELSTESDTCFLQHCPKNVVLISWKN